MDRIQAPQSDAELLDLLLRAMAILCECEPLKDESVTGQTPSPQSLRTQEASL
jgi:hypothetical protein